MEKNVATKNVFVVEDSVPVRTRLVEQLHQIDGVKVVGEAATPQEAVDGILETRPDYVVLDFQLDGGSGVDVLRAARLRLPATVFIVLTSHSQAQLRRICMAEGADAFLDKSTEFRKAMQIIVGPRPEM